MDIMIKNRNFFYSVLLVFSLLLSLVYSSCQINNNDDFLYLDNQWYYSTVDINGPYQPLDQKNLTDLTKFLPKKTGNIWLKTTFTIPPDLENKELSCFFGVVKIANEAYINNHYIGSRGHFPPKEFSVGDLSTSYRLPSSVLNYGTESNELIIKIWCHGYGKLTSDPFIGEESKIEYIRYFNDFYRSKFFLLFSVLMIVVSAIYIALYIFRPSEKQNLSFSGLTFFSSLFLVTVCIGEYPIILRAEYSYLLYEKIFHGLAGTLSSHFAVSFMRDFLYKKDSKKRTIYRLSLTMISVIILIVPTNLSSFFIHLGLSYFIIGIHMLYAIRLIVHSLIQKERNVFILLLGFSPVLLSLVIAVFMLFNPSNAYTLLIVALGWQLTILFFLVILIYKLSKSQTRVEYLNKNLEVIVGKRTSELEQINLQLEDRNNQLQFEKNRTQKEIELAAFVQQSFFNQDLPNFEEWEVAYYLKPLAGVSGDLYDFFHTDSKLEGLGIFDVSGHGISSGLVTMLVKNIIEQEFFLGKNEKLEDVMYIINDRVIEEKGNIENYLTGILVRTYQDSLDIVNAGHPSTLFFRKTKEKPEFIANDTQHCGVIGIADFPINLKPFSIDVESGDTFLFYTDGIIEATNSKKEDFGKDRLYETFNKYKNQSLHEQIYSILNDLTTFTGKNSFEDDITLLLLRKK